MKKFRKRFVVALVLVFLLMNIMAFFHARRFTHFNPGIGRREDPSKASFVRKLGILFSGVSLPRPVNDRLPERAYTTVILQSNVKIACWEMEAVQASKGTVVLCHGYGGKKADMLDRAYVFLDAGYNVLLPDFMGTGDSESNQCTIGYKEADNVTTCVSYLTKKGNRPIYLFGSSMGAAAIMRACNIDTTLPVRALILECPFGSMRQTVKNRFEMVGVPAFPLADLLVFWGGLQNGFNAFRHNPEDYALKIRKPVLLLCGGKDDRVKRFETEAVFAHLAGPKQHIYYPLAGHESYLNRYRQQWTGDVLSFLQQHP